MLVFVLNQAQKANTGKIQTPVYENVREFGWYGFLGHRGVQRDANTTNRQATSLRRAFTDVRQKAFGTRTRYLKGKSERLGDTDRQ